MTEIAPEVENPTWVLWTSVAQMRRAVPTRCSSVDGLTMPGRWRRAYDRRLRWLTGLRAEERCVTEAEHAAVGCRVQYPVPSGLAAIPIIERVQRLPAHRAVELRVAEGEDAAVRGHPQYPCPIGVGVMPTIGWLRCWPPIEP